MIAKLGQCKQLKHHQVKRTDHIEHDLLRANFDHSCLAPQLLQNFESDFSLHPHSRQNLASKFGTSLAGIGWRSFSVGAIELYISVTAPEGLKLSSTSGIKSECILALALFVFSSIYSIRRRTCSLFSGLST